MASRRKVVSSRRWEELHEELAESSAESSRLRTMYIATLQELSTAHQDAKSECIQAARLAVDERRRENKAVYEHNMRVEMAKAFEEGRQCQVGPMFGKDFEKTLELHDAYNILHEEQRSCFAAEREAKLLRVKLERSSADNRRHEEEAARNGKLEQEVESLRGKLEALKIAVKVEEVARSVQGQLVDMKQDDTTNDVPMELELPVSEAAMQVESPVPEAMVEEPASKEPASTEPASKEPASKEPAQDLAEFYASIGVVSQLGQRMQPPFEPTSTFKRLDPTSVTRLAREVANGHTLAHKPLHPFAAKKLELNRYIAQVEKTLGALQGQMSFSMLEVCKMWKEMQTANAKPEKAKPVKAKPEKAAQVEDKPMVKQEVINTDVIRKAVEEGVQKALATSSLVGAASSSSGAASSSLGVVGSLTWHGGLVDKIPKTMTDLELRYSANNLVVNAIQVEQKSMIARCKAEKDAAKAAKKQQMEARRLQKQIETNAAGKLTKAQLVAKVVDLEAELKKVRIELGSFEGLVQLHQAMYPDLLNIGKNDSGDEKVFESDSSVSDHSDSSDSNDSNTD